MEEKNWLETRSDLGKTIEIRCNKCGLWTLAYKWSITGIGKKCACGNMLYRHMCSEGYYSKVESKSLSEKQVKEHD